MNSQLNRLILLYVLCHCTRPYTFHLNRIHVPHPSAIGVMKFVRLEFLHHLTYTYGSIHEQVTHTQRHRTKIDFLSNQTHNSHNVHITYIMEYLIWVASVSPSITNFHSEMETSVNMWMGANVWRILMMLAYIKFDLSITSWSQAIWDFICFVMTYPICVLLNFRAISCY